MFNRVKDVKAIEPLKLQVQFVDGTVKKYDVEPLISEIPVFSLLRDIPGLFFQVKPDVGGYGICWNDEIDLSADELYENGEDMEGEC